MLVKLILIFIITITPMMSQKIHYYSYGYDGMEKYAKWNDSILVYSNYMAKPTLRKILCDTILFRYIKNKSLPNQITVDIKKAIIKGKIKIKKEKKLIHIEFFYEEIIWKDSIIEKPKKKFATKNKN